MAARCETAELRRTPAASSRHSGTRVPIKTGVMALGYLIGVAFLAQLCHVRCADKESLKNALYEEPFRILHGDLYNTLHKSVRPIKVVSFKDCKNDKTLPMKYLSFKPYTVIIESIIRVDYYYSDNWHRIASNQIAERIIRVILQNDIDLKKFMRLKPGESYIAKYGPFTLVEREHCLDTDWARQYRKEVPKDLFHKMEAPPDPSNASPESLHNVYTPYENNPFLDNDDTEFDEEWFDVYIHKPKNGKDDLQITLSLLTERESLDHVYLRYAAKFRCINMERYPSGRQGRQFPIVQDCLGLKRLEDILFYGERNYQTIYFDDRAEFGYWHHGGVRRRHYDFKSQALIKCCEGWALKSTKEKARWNIQPKVDFCWRKKWTNKGEYREEMDGKVSVELEGGKTSDRFLSIKFLRPKSFEMRRRIRQTGSSPEDTKELLLEELVPINILEWIQVRPRNARIHFNAFPPRKSKKHVDVLMPIHNWVQGPPRDDENFFKSPPQKSRSQFNVLMRSLNWAQVRPQNGKEQSNGSASLRQPVTKGLASLTIILAILVFVVIQRRLYKTKKTRCSRCF